MKEIYSIEIDRYNPVALERVLKTLRDNILNFEYDWNLYIHGGGIDYGVYLNINVDEKEITISNQPKYGSDGNDDLDEILDMLKVQ